VKWSNIPYAAPPNDEYARWAMPMPPQYTDGVIFDGSESRKCPQAQPGWMESALQFQEEFAMHPSTPLDSKWSIPLSPEDYGSVPPPEGLFGLVSGSV
jgi:hypothetical protein